MSIPLLPEKNLAPIKPLQELSDRDKVTSGYISDGIIELLKDKLKLNESTWKEIANTTNITSNFIQGKQIWQPNYWNNTWTIKPVNLADSSRITSINIMQFYCTSQMKMITQSNPDIEPSDEFRHRKYREAVRRNKAIWNRYERKFYKNWFNQQEALHAIISGTYIESVEYDHLANGLKVFKEVFGEKEIEISPGYSKCFQCGQEGSYADFTKKDIPSCPNCDSYEILPPESPITQKYNSIVGVEPVQVGELILRLKPIQAVRFDPRLRAEESSWMIFRQEVSKRKLEYQLGGLQLPTRTISNDQGLAALRNISLAGNTLGGLRSNNISDLNLEDTVIVDRLSVMPEDLTHIKPVHDEKTISGDVIKEGTSLADQCKDGATFLILDEKYVIGFYPGVHHSNEVTTGVYHMRLESGIGRGSDDTVEVQKRFNRFDAQNVKYMEVSATPAKTYIKGSVDREHVKNIGMPAAVLPINPEVAQMMGSRPVIEMLQPGTMAAQFFSYTYDILNQYRQLTSHATEFSNGFPGVDNKTATGVLQSKAVAESVFSPMLQIKSEVRVGTATKTMLQHNKYFKGIPQYFSFGETETGQSIGDYLSGEDVNKDIEWVVVRDSEQPKTMHDRQVDFVNMLNAAQAGGGIPVMKQSDPKLLDAMYRAFDIDIDDNVYSTISEVCEDRLEEALALQKQYQMMTQTVSSMGLQMPEIPIEGILMGLSQEIVLEEPNHFMKAKWYMDYLDTPEGFAMDNSKREVVRLFVRTHFQFELEQNRAMAAGFSQVVAAGAPPVPPDGNPEAEQQLEDSRHQNEMENKGADHAVELAKMQQQSDLEERRMDHEKELAQMKTDHELAIQKQKATDSQNLEKLKAKVAPKPKPTSKSSKK